MSWDFHCITSVYKFENCLNQKQACTNDCTVLIYFIAMTNYTKIPFLLNCLFVRDLNCRH